MNNELWQFIATNQLYSRSKESTHVSLFEPKGRFYLNYTTQEKFWEFYCNKLETEHEVVHGLAESPPSSQDGFIPIIADIDLSKEVSENSKLNPQTKLYNVKEVEFLIDIYQEAIRKIYDNIEDDDLNCYFLEKPSRKDAREGKDKIHYYIKNGFHLHFPIFVRKSSIISVLNPEVIKGIEKQELFQQFGGSKALDLSMPTKNPLIYGGRKTPEQAPYLLSTIYDANIVGSMSLREALSNYKLFSTDGTAIKVEIPPESKNIDPFNKYLPRLFSIFPCHRNSHELKNEQKEKLESEIIHKTMKSIPEYAPEEVKTNLEEASRLLTMISRERADDYEEWMKIGWILFNISESTKLGLDLWIEFSKTSTRKDVRPEIDCLNQWKKMKKGTLSIGSLMFYAKRDNPEEYKKYLRMKFKDKLIEGDSVSYLRLARYIHRFNIGDFVCCKNGSNLGSWYSWSGKIWEPNTITCLDAILPDFCLETLRFARKDCLKEMSADEVSEQDEKVMKGKIAAYEKAIKEIDRRSKRDEIAKDCKTLFTDTHFQTRLNANPNIVVFNNGTYDLLTLKFRDSSQEDYSTCTVGYDYRIFDPLIESDRKELFEVDDLLLKTYPDNSLRDFFMTVACSLLKGGNYNKVFVIFKGMGNNAKSIIMELLSATLGSYAVTLPTSLITGKRTQSSGATPELTRAKFAKLVILQEPSKGEILNSGVVKELTGNDKMYSRGLFEEGSEFHPFFKVFFVCNDLPNVGAEDLAFWKRARVLPHESTFDDKYPISEEEQFKLKTFPMDRNFSQKIPRLRQAFMWRLIEWYRKNGGIITIEPPKVLEATNKYRVMNDRYKAFVDEVFAPAKGQLVRDVVAYERYKGWMRESYPMSKLPSKLEFVEQITRHLSGKKPCKKGWEGYMMREPDQEDNKDDGNVAINEGHNSENDVRRFLEERTTISSSNLQMSILYAEYKEWCRSNNVEVLAEDEFIAFCHLEIDTVGCAVRLELKGCIDEEKDKQVSNSSKGCLNANSLPDTFEVFDVNINDCNLDGNCRVVQKIKSIGGTDILQSDGEENMKNTKKYIQNKHEDIEELDIVDESENEQEE
jgi:P4 family phage/plasmid primase-like protien